jgi:hypothetical protein
VERRGKRALPPKGHERKKSQWCKPDEQTCLLRALACKAGFCSWQILRPVWLSSSHCCILLWIVSATIYGLLLRCVWCVFSFLLLWFVLSRTAAAQLLASSSSPLRFAWTTERRSARGIPVRLASCSRCPALADLTAKAPKLCRPWRTAMGIREK